MPNGNPVAGFVSQMSAQFGTLTNQLNALGTQFAQGAEGAVLSLTAIAPHNVLGSVLSGSGMYNVPAVNDGRGTSWLEGHNIFGEA